MVVDFQSWMFALAGGAVLGATAGAFLLLQGRVLGISGILGGLWPLRRHERSWRLLFLAGLLLGGLVASIVVPERVTYDANRPMWMIIVAGLLVGFGTRLGSGCTSGHGVCGIARLSPRSLSAVGVFMATGMISAVLARQLLQ